jgi:hypothetical protein
VPCPWAGVVAAAAGLPVAEPVAGPPLVHATIAQAATASAATAAYPVPGRLPQ